MTLLPTPTSWEQRGDPHTDHRNLLPLGVGRLMPTPESKLSRSGPDYSRAGRAGSGGDDLVTAVDRLLPTPVSQPSGNSPEEHLRKKPGRDVVTDLSIIAENGLFGTGGRLLPTPMTSYSSRDVETWRAQRPAGNGNVREAVGDLAIVAEQILPTPRATDGTKGGPSRAGSSGDLMPTSAVQSERFGPYAPAIQRWEQVLGRPAPDPTEPGKNRPRLSSRFVEWLMGLDDGHVTGVGLTRNQELKALGNGVVPQQGAAALRHLDQIRRTS